MNDETFDFRSDYKQPNPLPSLFPAWAPAAVVDWLRTKGKKFPARTINCYLALVTDQRMRDVWAWHKEVFGRDEFGFCHAIESSTGMPSFPGDLNAAKREAYFAKVRKHTTALIELLRDTRFGTNCKYLHGMSTEDFDNERLAEIVEQDLHDWGDDETGHVVAYYVNEDGVSRMPWTYPDSSLCDFLHEVVEWTQEDDGWDWGLGLRSSKPLEDAKGKNRNVTYFTRTLFERLSHKGIAIPFPQLATVANVALSLSASAEVDEEAVRKQVRRYKGLSPGRPSAFGTQRTDSDEF